MATGNDEGSHTLSERIACLPKGRPRVYAGPGKGAHTLRRLRK
jgi:hypothetical protein